MNSKYRKELTAQSVLEKLKSTRDNAQKEVERNRKYYKDSMDVEKDLASRASAIAERLLVAILRENKVNVELDIDSLADKIVERINIKMPANIVEAKEEPSESFEFEKPELETIKIKKYEIKGDIGNKTRTADTTSESLDALLNLGSP